MHLSKTLLATISILTSLLLSSCSLSRYVPQGEYRLNSTKIISDHKQIDAQSYNSYLRQLPNNSIILLGKVKLALYSTVNQDTTNGWTRFIHKMGEPPVIYDSTLTIRSINELTRAMANQGYMRASIDTLLRFNNKKRKVDVTYVLHPNTPYQIASYKMKLIASDSVSHYIERDSLQALIKIGTPFDSKILDAERSRISTNLRNIGFYRFEKEFLYFEADTTLGSKQVAVTLCLRPGISAVTGNDTIHTRQKVSKISFISGFEPQEASFLAFTDTLKIGNYYFYYSNHSDVRPSVLMENCYLSPGQYYSQEREEKTYDKLAALRALKYINIRFIEDSLDRGQLHCVVLLTPGKNQSFTAQLEGTNTAGDFGVAGSLSYQHKNIFRGSELLKIQARGAYEMISGITNRNNDNYFEAGGEASITFPQFIFPFLRKSFRRTIRANTEFGLSFDYQTRPEFSRDIASIYWRYKWTQKIYHRHQFDLLDINYVYLPYVSNEFKNEYLRDDSYLKYSYEDHLIMKLGYSYNLTNQQPNIKKSILYNLRLSGETAGNLLYGIYKASSADKDNQGVYRIFNTPFAQYVKVDIDFSHLFHLNKWSSIAYHIAAGVAFPYGNSTILPFEKRYFAGGANSVRGWGIRTLGPGTYSEGSTQTNFMNQSGDIKLEFSIEARFKLFWMLEAAIFFDGGNVWTIKEYPNQRGGYFKLDTFYRQIALAYGIGIRLNADIFVLRLDLGAKLYDPSQQAGACWRAYQAGWNDMALHFAVGYPF